MKTYRSHWTGERLKDIRRRYGMSQNNLALLLGLPQQRISEWEVGLHSMSRAYSMLMDNLMAKLTPIKATAGDSDERYRSLVLQAFGVELKERHRREYASEAGVGEEEEAIATGSDGDGGGVHLREAGGGSVGGGG